MLEESTIKFEDVKAIILAYIHEETGWGQPLHPHYEIEELTILQLNEERDGTCTVSFEYMFNEDGFAKNDRTHILVGNVVISPTGKLLQKQLKETHRGVAAERTFEQKEYD
ncbi:MAG: hypothetical protein K9W42_13925 [Candidatus Heimdallarchaeota archaeon]|nr:hypothetical protein [Candidatus Heimdallarchaeota archaeon]